MAWPVAMGSELRLSRLSSFRDIRVTSRPRHSSMLPMIRGIDLGTTNPLLIGLVTAVWLMAALRWLSGKLADRLHP